MKKVLLIMMVLFLVSFMVGCNNQTTSLTELTTVTTTESDEMVVLEDSFYQYSINSTQNILILHLEISDDVEVFDTEDNPINKDDVLVKNNYYEIKSTYVLAQETDVVRFKLFFGNYQTLVVIGVSVKTVPYIISSSIKVTEGEVDSLFQFELYDGSFKQISGNDLEESDYEINENLLIIKSEYIKNQYFNNNYNFMVNYALETDEIVIGFISFYKEQ